MANDPHDGPGNDRTGEATAVPAEIATETVVSSSLPKPSKWAIWFIFITITIDMIGIGLVLPVLPRLISDVSGADLAGASVIYGLLFVAYGGCQFLFGPAIGNLSDAVGRRPVLLLSLLGLGVDYLLTALAPTLFWLFVGRIVAGICGASYVTANAYLADITKPEERAQAFGLMGAAFGIGFVIGPAIGGLLGTFGPRVPFFVAAAFSLANVAFGYFVLPESLPQENRRSFDWRRANPLGTLRVFARYRGVVPLAVAMFAFFFAGSVYQAIWTFWGIARFGWSEATIGLTLAAFGISTAFTQGFLTGPAVRRFGEWWTMVLGLTMSLIATIGYGFAPGLLVVLALLVVHAPEGFVHPAMTALMSAEAPADAQGELQGGLSSLQSLALMLGTLFFSQIFGYFMQPAAVIVSPSIAYFVAAALIGLTLLGVIATGRPSKSDHGSQLKA